jgi:hypothetical protein
VHIGPAGGVEEEVSGLIGIASRGLQATIAEAVSKKSREGLVEIESGDAGAVKDLIRGHEQRKMRLGHVEESQYGERQPVPGGAGRSQIWLQVMVRGFWHPGGHLAEHWLCRGQGERALKLQSSGVALAEAMGLPGPALGWPATRLPAPGPGQVT